MADPTIDRALGKTRGQREAATAQPRRNRAADLIIVFYIIAATLVLLALAFSAHTTPYYPIDLAIAHAVQSFHPAWFDFLMRFVGEPGYPPQVYVLVVWILVVLWVFGLKWEAVAEAFAIVGIGAVGLLVKVPVDRPRPNPNLIHVANPSLDGGKFSFPAGHVESFVAIFGFLMFLLIVLGKPSWLHTFELIFFGLLIALIGLSRIYVGEHWFSDTIGGYLLGSVWLAITIRFYYWGKPRFFVQQPRR